MIPGLTTKLSEELMALTTTISPTSDLVHINSTTSTTVLATIRPAFGGGFGGFLVLVNRSGLDITTTTTGNIARAVTVTTNQTCIFVYSALTGKFYPGAIS